MNARHLFRYARYALAALACRLRQRVELSSDLAGRGRRITEVTEPIRTGRRLCDNGGRVGLW